MTPKASTDALSGFETMLAYSPRVKPFARFSVERMTGDGAQSPSGFAGLFGIKDNRTGNWTEDELHWNLSTASLKAEALNAWNEGENRS